MEPVTLAAAAVGTLVPYLGQLAGGGLARLGEAAAEGVSQHIVEMYRAIRSRITGAPYEEAVLDNAEAQPDNEGRRAALQNVLAELLSADPDFAARLDNSSSSTEPRRATYPSRRFRCRGRQRHPPVGTYVAGRDLQIGDVSQS